MSAFEKEKEKNHPKQVDLNSQDAQNSQEQTKSGAEVYSDKKSPASKSADSDIDRKKFFQSLLQSKNGPKLEAAVPNTIPEESESEPNSPAREEISASSDDSTTVVETDVQAENIHSECNGDVDEKLAHPEESSSKVEDSLSATGVSSDVRGAEVAEQSVDQRTDFPDKGPNPDSGEIGESQAETSNISEKSATSETETDERENSTTLPSTETTLAETDQSAKGDESVDEKPTESPPESENKENAEEVSSGENKNGENDENRTTNDSLLSDQVNENLASSKEGKDLLDEKHKPKDVDSSLTIAVKSSYIGAPCEASEDTESRSETTEVSSRTTEVSSREESVDPSESVAKIEDKSSAQSEEKQTSVESSPTSTASKPSQPGSPSSTSQTGAESSPASTASAAAAGTSNGDSPELKSTYRAYVNIPEYLWSPIHQRLLGDLLFAIESDVQVWRR